MRLTTQHGPVRRLTLSKGTEDSNHVETLINSNTIFSYHAHAPYSRPGTGRPTAISRAAFE